MRRDGDPVVERDGVPIDVGRKHRTAPTKLRRALEIRDRFCRFPGCAVPAQRTHAHHHDPWYFGGGTNLADMLLLCSYHHGRYHEGAYRIVKAGDDFRFETNDGQVIGKRAQLPPEQSPPVDELAARAEWGGAHLDFDHLMFVISDAFVPN